MNRRSKGCWTKRGCKEAGNPKRETDSKQEQIFLNSWRKYTNVPIQTQYKFHPIRQFRFDFAFPEKRVAVEIQGYGEGHNSYKGMHSDYTKHNQAILLGWRIAYFMSADLKPQTIKETITTVLNILGVENGIRGEENFGWESPFDRARRLLAERTNNRSIGD